MAGLCCLRRQASGCGSAILLKRSKMSEDQKKQLQTSLWNIANELRGKMDADEFRDYIFGFIFYKYLLEKLELYADTELLLGEGDSYKDVADTDFETIDEIRAAALEHLGYFLLPSELFTKMAERTELDDYIEESVTCKRSQA